MVKTTKTRTRKRVMPKDKEALVQEPVDDEVRDGPEVEDDLPWKIESPGTVEPEVFDDEAGDPSEYAVPEMVARIPLPTHAEGCNVFDAVGNRVAICGYDSNRAASGPALAKAVSSALNRVHGK
jgi:hypothetical protein